MSMSPIVQNVQGQTLTFLLPLASLNSALPASVLNETIRLYADVNIYGSSQDPFRDAHGTIIDVSTWKPYEDRDRTATLWADVILASPPAQKPNIPDDQIISVLKAALIGGGMAAALAADTADRIYHGQLNQSVSMLAATIAKSAIAAGS